MNKRIDELFGQTMDQVVPETWTTLTHAQLLIVKDKFAELLVRECVNAVMDGTKEGDHYAMRIEQHFDNGPGGILHHKVEESTVDQQLRNRSTYFGNNP
jgi:hypothetical protein